MMRIIKDEKVLSYQDEHMDEVQKEQEKIGRILVKNNSDTKYSTMLLELIGPYLDEDPEPDDLFFMLDMGTQAWNMSNIETKMPNEFHEMLEPYKNKLLKEGSVREVEMMEEMLERKRKNYSQYDLFIADYDVKQTGNGMCNVVVVCQNFEQFLTNQQEQENNVENDENQYESGYVNRSSVSLKPKQAFVDWVLSLYPDETAGDILTESNSYLIEEKEYGQEAEEWLRKKFDKLFMIELDAWCSDKKKWPQYRSYKMFREWFEIGIYANVFDLENYPVEKQ